MAYFNIFYNEYKHTEQILVPNGQIIGATLLYSAVVVIGGGNRRLHGRSYHVQTKAATSWSRQADNDFCLYIYHRYRYHTVPEMSTDQHGWTTGPKRWQVYLVVLCC